MDGDWRFLFSFEPKKRAEKRPAYVKRTGNEIRHSVSANGICKFRFRVACNFNSANDDRVTLVICFFIFARS